MVKGEEKACRRGKERMGREKEEEGRAGEGRRKREGEVEMREGKRKAMWRRRGAMGGRKKGGLEDKE